MQREIVQIAVVAGDGSNPRKTLFALAGDGSVWIMADPEDREPKWEELPALPAAPPMDVGA